VKNDDVEDKNSASNSCRTNVLVGVVNESGGEPKGSSTSAEECGGGGEREVWPELEGGGGSKQCVSMADGATSVLPPPSELHVCRTVRAWPKPRRRTHPHLCLSDSTFLWRHGCLDSWCWWHLHLQRFLLQSQAIWVRNPLSLLLPFTH